MSTDPTDLERLHDAGVLTDAVYDDARTRLSSSEVPTELHADLERLHDAGVLTDAEYDDALTRVGPVETPPADPPQTDPPPADVAAGATGPGEPPVEDPAATPPGPGLTSAPPPTDVGKAAAGDLAPPEDATTSSADDAPTTVLVPADPNDPNAGQVESPVEPPPVKVDAPCPNCGRAPTSVTVATPVAVNPPVAADGTEVMGGDTIHLCEHCGQVLAVLGADVEAAAADIQAAFEEERDQAAADTGIAPDEATATYPEGTPPPAAVAAEPSPVEQEAT